MRWRVHYQLLPVIIFSLAMLQAASAQSHENGRGIMWQPVNVKDLDLYAGPGGDEMRPDLSKIELIKEEKGGHNKKYRLKDGAGRVWVAKLGREARPETAAVRLLYGLGYKTEVNYLVPTITIPGKGTFKNVRLEARPDNIERMEEWKWKSNPFIGTKELQGLKIMMIFMSNWDAIDIQNKVLGVGGERYYIISDLGATFGRLGNNNLPIIFRLGRKTGSPKAFAKTRFVKGVKNGEVRFAYKGKNRSVFKGFTVKDVRWLANRFRGMTDEQISDIFRAANYSPAEIAIYTATVRRKITELQQAAGSDNLAER